MSLCMALAAAAAPVRQHLHDDWQFRQARLNNWYPATVPGTVHTDLMANRIIEDPYFRLNERGVQWVDKEDWIYETHFEAGADLLARERIELDLRRTRHLCRRLPQRREGARRRQHVPPLAHGGQTAAPSGRKHPESLFPLADQGRPAQIRLAALPLRGRQRSVGQRRAFRQTRQRLRPQGGLPLRLGLGSAPGDLGHLASRSIWRAGAAPASAMSSTASRRLRPGAPGSRSRWKSPPSVTWRKP